MPSQGSESLLLGWCPAAASRSPETVVALKNVREKNGVKKLKNHKCYFKVKAKNDE